MIERVASPDVTPVGSLPAWPEALFLDPRTGDVIAAGERTWRLRPGGVEVLPDRPAPPPLPHPETYRGQFLFGDDGRSVYFEERWVGAIGPSGEWMDEQSIIWLRAGDGWDRAEPRGWPRSRELPLGGMCPNGATLTLDESVVIELGRASRAAVDAWNVVEGGVRVAWPAASNPDQGRGPVLLDVDGWRAVPGSAGLSPLRLALRDRWVLVGDPGGCLLIDGANGHVAWRGTGLAWFLP